MRWLWLVFLAVVVWALQIAWLPLVRPFGVVPDAALVLVVLAALEHRAMVALVVALALGLALDLVSGGIFGSWTGAFVLEVLVGALVRRSGIETGGWLVPGVMVVGGTLAVAILVLSALVGSVSAWAPGSIVGRLILEILLNLGLVGLLRPLVRLGVRPEVGDSHG